MLLSLLGHERKSPYCKLTKIPVNGLATFLNDTHTFLPIDHTVPLETDVKFACTENYFLVGAAITRCVAGSWNSEVPECNPLCPAAELSSKTFQAKCFNIDYSYDGPILRTKKRFTSCSLPSESGTTAEITCKPGYEGPSQEPKCDPQGQWVPKPVPCVQKCGEFDTTANYTGLPWQVSIYRRKGQDFNRICSGTIITAKVVISAMQCFWHERLKRPHFKSEFQIATGNLSQEFSITEGLTIGHIYYDFNSKGNKKYAVHLAVLELNDFIEFTNVCYPICIDYHLNHNDQNVAPGLKGYMAGWVSKGSKGDDNNNPSSFVLKRFEMPVVSSGECENSSPSAFRRFLSEDKFCASPSSDWKTCQGNSGSGIAFAKTEQTATRFYLGGVVSVASDKLDSCNNDQFALITNVVYYSDFLQHYESRKEGKLKLKKIFLNTG